LTNKKLLAKELNVA